jgi:hypothetical protein
VTLSDHYSRQHRLAADGCWWDPGPPRLKPGGKTPDVAADPHMAIWNRRPRWACPRCQRRFAIRNQSHSCGRHDLAHHFQGKDRTIRLLFETVRRAIATCGPVIVLPEKTRIAFQVRMSFAQVTPRQHWLDGHVVLADGHIHASAASTLFRPAIMSTTSALCRRPRSTLSSPPGFEKRMPSGLKCISSPAGAPNQRFQPAALGVIMKRRG